MGFLEDILGIGKKIKDTIMTTSPASYLNEKFGVKDKLSDAVGATFNTIKDSVPKIATTVPKIVSSVQKRAADTPIMPFIPQSKPKNLMNFKAPLERQTSDLIAILPEKLRDPVTNAFPIVQVPSFVGENVRQIGRAAGLQPKPLDVASVAIPMIAGKMQALRSPKVDKAIQLLRNKLTKEDVATIGKFAEAVETKGGKAALDPELGNTIHSLAKNVFGSDAENWTNQKLKNVFDLVLGKIGQGKNSAGLGLRVESMRTPKEIAKFEATLKKTNAEELLQKAKSGTKTAQEIIESVRAKPRDVNAALKTGAINPDEATALKGNVDDLISKAKTRGFTETVMGAKKTPKVVKEALKQSPESSYNPTTDKATMERVKKEIMSKGEDSAIAVAHDATNPDANATALQLMEKYIKSGDDEKLTQLVKEVSPRFTEQGQAIQILNMYGKLTPSGAVRYTQKIINQANKLLPKNRQIELTPQTTKEVTALAKEIGKYKEGTREYTVAVAKLLDRVSQEAPVSLGQKISTIQTMAQLLNPKTMIRNTVGNMGFAAIENVKDVVATGIDTLISKATGKRTKVMPSLSTQIKGAKEGFKLGLEDALMGIDTSGGIKTQLDLPNKTFRTGFLGGAEKALNIGLRATDRAAYTAAYDESLRQQMTAAGVKQATEEMIGTAHADGLYKTFQDDSKLSQIFSGVKKILNKVGTSDGKFGLGDIVLKYPKTPANLLSRGVDYSPAGFLKTAYEIYKPLVSGDEFQQKKVVESLSRALTGSAVVALGYVLGKMGVVTGKPEKDYDIKAAQRMSGEGGFKFNVDAFKRWFASGFDSEQAKPQNNDTLVSYDWFQPTSFTLSMGVNAAQGSKDAKDYMSALADGLNAGVQTLAEQPLVTGITRLASTTSLKGAASAFLESLAGAPSGFVPSLANQIGQATDNTTRETYDPNMLVENLINKTKARIPGLRNTLPEKKNVFGQTMETYQNGSNNLFNVFLNPAWVSKIKRDPEAKEVLDIFERSGETQQAPRLVDKSIKVNGEPKKLSADEYQKYQTYVGQKTQVAFQDLMDKPKWATMSDEDKAKEMSAVMSDINSAAKVELFGQEYSKSTSKNVKQIVAGTLYPMADATTVKSDLVTPETTPSTLAPDTQKLIDAYDLNKYMDNKTTGLEKFKTEKGKVSEVTKIFEGDTGYENLDDTQKKSLIEALGYKVEDVQYESMAKEDTDVKVKYLISEVQAGTLDHDAFIRALQNGRKKSISGTLFASNAVIDDLATEGYLTAAEKKALKAINYNSKGQVQSTGTGTTAAKKALIKGITNPPELESVKALMEETKAKQAQQVKVPTVSPDVTLSMPNAKNTVPVKVKDLITKAKTPSGIAKARAIIDSVRVGGSTGNAANTPTKLSRSSYRPSLRG